MEAATFPWSACFQNGNPRLCSKSCDSKVVGRTVKRELYGDDSWVYKEIFHRVFLCTTNNQPDQNCANQIVRLKVTVSIYSVGHGLKAK